MTKYLRIGVSLALIAMLTGTTELNSIAQINYTTPKVYQVQTEKLYQIASISDTTEKSKEVKIEDVWYIKEIPMDYEEQKFLHSLCERFDIPYTLMLAQIRCESNFDNSLIGSCGDTGYFQILPSWDKYLEQELSRKVNLKDSFDNLESGTLLMYYNLLSAKDYEGKEKYVRALNAFNQGGQSSLNYARRNGYNAWHYGKRIYKCFQEYESGNYSYDPYKN